MNKFFLTLATAFFAFTFLLSSAGLVSAQRSDGLSAFAPELRPFDFTKEYYDANGIIPDYLIDRHDGGDGQSVFDTSTDPNHTNVRITATMPAYSAGGIIVFWNYYAGLPREGFMENQIGANARVAAYDYPLYVFPSTTVKNTDRQAAMITIDENYSVKNPLGVAAVIMVEFTQRIFTPKGQWTMNMLRERNGASLDGTPIIRTVKELETLTIEGYVTQTQAEINTTGRTPFAVAKVIESPESGAIAPDAFLVYVKQADGQALLSERNIVSYFECLRTGEAQCF